MDERESPWTSSWCGRDLLAFVEHRDVVAGQDGPVAKTFTLDVVAERDLAQLLGGGASARGELPSLPTAQVVVSVPPPTPDDLQAFDEGTWHRVRLDAQGAYPARLFRDLDGAESDVTRLTVRAPIDPAAQDQLLDFVSINDAPEASATDLGVIALQGQQVGYVAVVHVGQGNCNALCDVLGVPFLYLDMGAGCLQNTHTRPVGLEFCFTNRPQVVLSHWDFDHWYGGSTSTAEATVKPVWFAPAQPIGVRTRKFAARLVADGRLRKWPLHRPTLTNGSIELLPCLGTTKNDSGIALAARTPAGIVLCPADAAFDYVPIPSIARGRPLAGLVATHHGSTHVGSPVPRPADGAVLAFSFGANNTYQHPTGSRTLYRSEGWTRQLDTPTGSVALGAHHRPAPCGGTSCALATTQS